jgi:hypothetical protein
MTGGEKIVPRDSLCFKSAQMVAVDFAALSSRLKLAPSKPLDCYLPV